MLKKLKSRKFICAILGVAAGVMVSIGADGQIIANIASGIIVCASISIYIYTEGKVDVKGIEIEINKNKKDVGQSIDEIKKTLDIIQNSLGNKEDNK